MSGILLWWLLIVIAVAIVMALIRYVRRRALIKDRLSEARRCDGCGYNLTGITVPRCPECGVVIGFTKTFEQLGIDEAQVRRHVQARREDAATDSRTDGDDC